MIFLCLGRVHRLVSALTLCLLSAYVARAQQHPAPDPNLPIPTNVHLASEPSAVNAMQEVFTALGGRGWKSIHTAESHAVVSSPLSGLRQDVYMTDDWTTDEVKYRRHLAGSPDSPTDHSDGRPWKIQVNGKNRTIPEYDQASTLVLQMPGAAIDVLLRRHDYYLRNASARVCPTGMQCVDVYLTSAIGIPIKIQEWDILSSTKLPYAVRFQIHGWHPVSRPFWETITYKKFDLTGTTLTPIEVAVTRPNGLIDTFTFSPPLLNIVYETARFDQEHAQ